MPPGKVTTPPGKVTTPSPSELLPHEPIPYAVSGSRLDGIGYRVEGASQFRTFKDTLLGFECAFTPDGASEAFHCLPRYTERLVFLDANCTEPAIWTGGHTEPEPGTWVSAKSEAPQDVPVGPNPPEPQLDAFQVGGKVYDWFINGPAAPEVYESQDGRCVGAAPNRGRVPPNVYAAFAVDNDKFVGAKQVTIEVTRDISITRFVADDGAALTNGLLTHEGRPCHLQPSGDCVPLPIAVRGGSFLDAKCEEPSFYLNTAAEPETTLYGVDSGSGSDTKVYELKVAGSVHNQELVLPIPLPPAGYAYTCGPAMSVETEVQYFAPARDVTGSLPGARRIALGTGALRSEWFGIDTEGSPDPVLAQPASPDPGVFLQVTGLPCTILPAADGSLRCAPLYPEVSESGYWKDPSCTERLLGRQSTSQPFQLEEARFLEYDDSRALKRLSSLKAYTGPTYAINNGTCSPVAAPSTGPEGSLEIDEQLDVGLLPLVQEVAL
jgi:hypothetical protein